MLVHSLISHNKSCLLSRNVQKDIHFWFVLLSLLAGFNVLGVTARQKPNAFR